VVREWKYISEIQIYVLPRMIIWILLAIVSQKKFYKKKYIYIYILHKKYNIILIEYQNININHQFTLYIQ